MNREEAIKLIDTHTVCFYNEIDSPTLQALHLAIEALSERPKGEWKTTVTGQPYCSNCEYVFGEDEEFSPFWNYCPMCGAKGGDAE